MISYTTTGVCAKQINFKIKDEILKEIKFLSGCPGNLEGIEKLVEGLHIDEVIKRLKGIACGPKKTSCPDQLAKALEEYKAQSK